MTKTRLEVDNHHVRLIQIFEVKMKGHPLKSRKCGKSAVDYLTFQRHLMYISGCMTVISLLGPLPANTMGKLLIETNAYFAKTTIGNLSVDNILIWGCFLVRINYRTKESVLRRRQASSKMVYL